MLVRWQAGERSVRPTFLEWAGGWNLKIPLNGHFGSFQFSVEDMSNPTVRATLMIPNCVQLQLTMDVDSGCDGGHGHDLGMAMGEVDWPTPIKVWCWINRIWGPIWIMVCLTCLLALLHLTYLVALLIQSCSSRNSNQKIIWLTTPPLTCRIRDGLWSLFTPHICEFPLSTCMDSLSLHSRVSLFVCHLSLW